MARPQKPWYRKQTGWWMVEFDGKQEKLVEGPKDEVHRILAEENFVELRKLRRIAPESVGKRTVDIIESFLRHSRLHFAADTHRLNKYYLQILAESCGQILARDIKPLHIQRMIDDRKDPEKKRKDLVINKFPVLCFGVDCSLLLGV